MVIKRSGGEFAGGGRSTSKSTCVVPTWNLTAFGDRSASSMSKQSPAWTLTSEMVTFGSKSVTLSMKIDLLTCRCRSTQVKIYTSLIASTDLWPQEMFTILEMLALVESESCFGAYVCHYYRRPGGSTATSDLVRVYKSMWYRPRCTKNAPVYKSVNNIAADEHLTCMNTSAITELATW